mgnify:CR=1 FL=1
MPGRDICPVYKGDYRSLAIIAQMIVSVGGMHLCLGVHSLDGIDIDDDDVLEQTFLVCITLLLGGNKKSQDAFFHYFQHQDQSNVILMKLKRLLMEHFDLTKKFIGEKNAKLAMIYKVNQREAHKK